jgi:hypothetical protein
LWTVFDKPESCTFTLFSDITPQNISSDNINWEEKITALCTGKWVYLENERQFNPQKNSLKRENIELWWQSLTY